MLCPPPRPETPDPVTRKTGSIWVKPPLLLQHHSQSVTTFSQCKQGVDRANLEIRVVSRASKMGELDLSWWKASNPGKLVWETHQMRGWAEHLWASVPLPCLALVASDIFPLLPAFASSPGEVDQPLVPDSLVFVITALHMFF